MGKHEAISNQEWQSRIQKWLDIRPEENIYRIAREAFTDEALFDLEMELIFEKTWIFACHESQLPKPNTFFSITVGKQPVLITRDENNELHALVNTCAHRGSMLTRLCKGSKRTFVCPFHGWSYKMNGELISVKAAEGYAKGFDKEKHNLSKALIENYKGFVFVNLDIEAEQGLEAFLGDAKIGFDMMVEQSVSGELEVIPGSSRYSFDGNWKLQNENGLDGYHVSTVHFNYVSTIQHRQQLDSEKESSQKKKTLDYSKLGASDPETDDGWFAFANGHTLLYSDMPNASVRPGYQAVMPRLQEEYGELRAKWVMHMLRNLNIYPSLFFMDQISSQLRVIRPVAWNKTEVLSFCVGVKGESSADRENRIRQFEDFFNVSGLGTPDDLSQFQSAQTGFEGRRVKWNDISRGSHLWTKQATTHCDDLNLKPVLIGTEFTQEGLFTNQHKSWQDYLLNGLASKEE
jgi:anthranilate 1,2-dioxygenase (deaminating, decarboxylating) large subunit